MATEKPPTRTLLQKYEIPVENLDFTFIKNCKDAKMVERIVKILRSGEEGYYPDLTKCAEEKLRELKPNSKMFRVEEPVVRKEFLDHEKREQFDTDIKLWIDEMKKQDKIIKEIKPVDVKKEPPIRTSKENKKENSRVIPKHYERIKSTDYDKWDKFDADAAELKIDLDEERQREMVECKNKKNLQKSKLIEEIEEEKIELSEFERNRLSLQFKERGNEAFKACDYDEAIKEYTQSIQIKKNAAAFNNRALVYLKQKCYLKVISDTNECLLMEPKNIKALLRKAQAFLGQNMLTEAHDTFEKILQIDSSNETAQKEILLLQKKMPPKNSFRMKIEEIEEVKEESKESKEKSAEVKKIMKNKKSEKLDLPEQSHVPKLFQNIIVDEPSPFDKFKKKEEKTREKLILPSEVEGMKAGKSLIQEIN